MRIVVCFLLLAALAACDAGVAKAKHIVERELGAPRIVDFRNIKKKSDGTEVCGEVSASDKPGTGWRRFIAFVELERAVIAPDDSPIGAEAEMGNPLLKGAAEKFMHACD